MRQPEDGSDSTRLIRGEGIKSQSGQSAGLCRVVDDPCTGFQAGSFRGSDESSRKRAGSGMKVDPIHLIIGCRVDDFIHRARLVIPADDGLVLTDTAKPEDRGIVQEFFHHGHLAQVESNDRKPLPLFSARFDFIDKGENGLKAGAFEFDEQLFSLGQHVNDFAEPGNPSALVSLVLPLTDVDMSQVGQGSIGDFTGVNTPGESGSVFVMEDNKVAVMRGPYIALTGVRSQPKSQFEGGQGVFRCQSATGGSPVGNDDWRCPGTLWFTGEFFHNSGW